MTSHEYECPCCGDLAAKGVVNDGDDLLCGCSGWVSADAESCFVVIEEDGECSRWSSCRNHYEIPSVLAVPGSMTGPIDGAVLPALERELLYHTQSAAMHNHNGHFDKGEFHKAKADQVMCAIELFRFDEHEEWEIPESGSYKFKMNLGFIELECEPEEWDNLDAALKRVKESLEMFAQSRADSLLMKKRKNDHEA